MSKILISRNWTLLQHVVNRNQELFWPWFGPSFLTVRRTALVPQLHITSWPSGGGCCCCCWFVCLLKGGTLTRGTRWGSPFTCWGGRWLEGGAEIFKHTVGFWSAFNWWSSFHGRIYNGSLYVYMQLQWELTRAFYLQRLWQQFITARHTPSIPRESEQTSESQVYK